MKFDEFKGATCVVTGAAGGIGCTLARTYAEAGANVVMIDVNEPVLNKKAEAIKKEFGVEVLPLVVDLTKVAAINEAVDTITKKFGGVKALANCAGISLYTPVLRYTESDWDLSFNLNIKGMFFLSKGIAQNMIDNGVKNGKIVCISSQAGIVGEPGGVAYASSKAAVSMMVQVMALDLAEYGICVNAVAPGCTNTEMIQKYLERACKDEGMTKEEFEAYRHNMVPLKRFAEPQEVADLMFFLSSDAANYITGTTVRITGGNITV